MDNKQFRDAVYVKYEYQQKHNNDEFFNTHYYRKNTKKIILNKVAVFICTLLMGSVVYAGNMIYQYFNQKTSQGDITQETESWFETNNEAIYYKKVSSYEEYQKYKEKQMKILCM